MLGMILVDREIRQALATNELAIQPCIQSNIGPNSYDFTLSPSFFYQEDSNKKYVTIDPHAQLQEDFNQLETQEFELFPGEFVLGSSIEYFKIKPGIVGFVHGRSSWARLGIQIHAAGLCDSGWEGNITLEIVNFNRRPIKLRAGDKIGQITFHRVSCCTTPYCQRERSKYNEQLGATPSRLYVDYNTE